LTIEGRPIGDREMMLEELIKKATETSQLIKKYCRGGSLFPAFQRLQPSGSTRDCLPCQAIPKNEQDQGLCDNVLCYVFSGDARWQRIQK
jgi:hypothetical protein